MNSYSYPLNNEDYLLSHSGMCLEYTYGWLLQNWYDTGDGSITYLDGLATYGDSAYQEQNLVTDDFLIFSCGYGDYFNIARLDVDSMELVSLYSDTNASVNYGNALAIDKTRKLVWAAEYASATLNEYDYWDMYYSGATSPTVNRYDGTDGIVGTTNGLGATGGNIWHDDTNKLLYMANRSISYETKIYRWNTVTKLAEDSITLLNNSTTYGFGQGSGGMVYEPDKDRLMFKTLYSTGISHIVISGVTNSATTKAIAVTHPTVTSSHGMNRVMARSPFNEDHYLCGYWSQRLVVIDLEELLTNTGLTTSTFIRPTCITYNTDRGESIGNWRFDWNDRYAKLSYSVVWNDVRRLDNGNYRGQGAVSAKPYGIFPDFKNSRLIGPVTQTFGDWATENNQNTDPIPVISDYVNYYGGSGFISSSSPYFFGRTNYESVYASSGGTPFTFFTANTYYTDIYFGLKRAWDFSGITPYNINTGYTVEWGTFNNWTRVSDNLITIISASTTNTGWFENGDGYWQKTGLTQSDLIFSGDFKENAYYEIIFDIDDVYRTVDDTSDYNEFNFFDDSSIKKYYGRKSTKFFTNADPSTNPTYLYLKSLMESTLKNIEIYEVVKSNIDSISIDNFFNVIQYPHSATTFTLYVSCDDGVTWENWPLDQTIHNFTNKGTEGRVKIVQTNDDTRLVGAYMAGNESPVVRLYSFDEPIALTTEGETLIKISGADSNIPIYKKP